MLTSSDAPYLSGLARRYGQAVASFGMAHPSLPNYLALVAGSTLGITSDCTDCSVEGTTLVDQLRARGVGWRAYMEGMPGPCYTEDSTPWGYAKKHDPFMYFPHLVRDPAQCRRIVPFSRLATDLASGTAPPFLWVTPDLCHDGHDCPTSTMDTWLHHQLPSVLSSSWYRPSPLHPAGVVIITFDEGSTDASCCRATGAEARNRGAATAGADGGHILTLVVSPSTPPRSRLAAPIDPAGILATIEDLYGLDHLRAATCPCSGNLLALLGRA